jgi:kynureninase
VLRVPADCGLRPVITGWFSEFADLADDHASGAVRYGAGAARFAGSTFDPTSAYRAAAVFDFFEERGLGIDLLRAVSQHQVGVLADTFRSFDLAPGVASLDESVRPDGRGGFLSIRAPRADRLREALLERGVRADARGTSLRFGPAPYHSDAQLVTAMEALADAVSAGEGR